MNKSGLGVQPQQTILLLVTSWRRRTSRQGRRRRQWRRLKHASIDLLNHWLEIGIWSKGAFAFHQGQIGLVSTMLLRLIVKALGILLVGDKEFGLFAMAIGQGGFVEIHQPLTVGSHVNQGGMMNHQARQRGFAVCSVVGCSVGYHRRGARIVSSWAMH